MGKELNGYELFNRLKKARRRYPLTATEQALYHELVAMCNDVEWEDIFSASNFELCASLSIDEKTLIKSRNILIQAGLIFYQSGKSRRSHSLYSFSKSFKQSTGIIPAAKPVTKPVDEPVDQPVANPESTGIIPDYNSKQTKLKFRDNVVLSKKEHESLVERFGNDFTEKCYDYLHDYKIEKGYKTKSDYMTICRWVHEAVRKANPQATIVQLTDYQIKLQQALTKAKQRPTAEGDAW